VARKPWAGEEAVTSFASADNTGLRAEAARASGGTWTVSDVAGEMGHGHENRRLAEKLLAEKGITSPTDRQVSSQMRNIQRWLNAERGETGKQAHKPSKGTQATLNKLGRRAAHGNDSARVNINGGASVNGYRRKRDIEVTLDPDASERFFDALDSGDTEGAWAELASGYHVGELHAYDAQIDISY
jgi:hypothetical protein